MSVKFASPSIAAAGLASLAFHAKRGFGKRVAMDQDGRFAIANTLEAKGRFLACGCG
jgi:hypothetical protein